MKQLKKTFLLKFFLLAHPLQSPRVRAFWGTDEFANERKILDHPSSSRNLDLVLLIILNRLSLDSWAPSSSRPTSSQWTSGRPVVAIHYSLSLNENSIRFWSYHTSMSAPAKVFWAPTDQPPRIHRLLQVCSRILNA